MPTTLEDAISQALTLPGLSDIHLSVNEPLWARLSGPMQRLTKESFDDSDVRFYLKQAFGLNAPDSLSQHKGGYDFAAQLQGQRLRCNLFTHQGGSLGMVIRRLREQIPALCDLGLPTSIEAQCGMSKGLFFVTGPTGSGKTTTLAAMLHQINQQRDAHIITIEDPIEYPLPSARGKVTQREIGRDVDSFSDAVRAALRQDPDVIMIGEVRDQATMKAALEAAETGHLVLATLHTVSAHQSVNRVTSFFDGAEKEWARNILASVLNGVLAQNLLRTTNGLPILAYELLLATPGIRTAIMKDDVHVIPNLMETGRKDGQVRMHTVLTELVRSQRVTAEEARYATYDASRFDQALERGE